MSNQLRAGYLFKPTHSEVHFVKKGHGSSGDDYGVNFTREVDDSKIFSSEDEAKECIYSLLSDLDIDDEYVWTPVITDVLGKVVKDITPMFTVGSAPFKEMYSD